MPEMITKSGVSGAENDVFGVDAENPEAWQRAQRLKTAVRASGGNKAVAEKSGVPLNTLTRYLQGGEMKVGNVVSLAEATGFRLEWLLAGRGPRNEAEAAAERGQAPAPGGEARERKRDLFAQVNMDRMAQAYTAAIGALAAHGHGDPEPRRLVQVMVLLYDQLSDAEATDR
ncbi:hypothetical protein [Plastoroseomonas hellenica]|uniref:hypothetical protein n=1 Tax=Plastoroseomonas hellenica TaxID=2687306 RepID=UPI001BA6AADD|nr:hypothetical protein [Plastoroseomonas hellenica]MBR0644022.1 hypothetical protein [Plastoroseomonas hellenica]